jgi:hypothetical protein
MVSVRSFASGPVSVMRPLAKLWITPRAAELLLQLGVLEVVGVLRLFLRARQADLGQADADRRLSGDEGGAAGGATLRRGREQAEHQPGSAGQLLQNAAKVLRSGTPFVVGSKECPGAQPGRQAAQCSTPCHACTCPGCRAAVAHNAPHTTKEWTMAELHGVNRDLIASLPDTGPVVMVNLLRLRDREAYKRYSELTMPLIKARGGTVLWAGNGEAVAFGDPSADR